MIPVFECCFRWRGGKEKKDTKLNIADKTFILRVK